ncbi:MAG: hypothetical protein ACO3UU_12190 [Minisyncoccia bacterium]
MTNNEVVINQILKLVGLENFVDVGEVSDGFHTFNQLYEHRNLLFCFLLTLIYRENLSKFQVWKALKHSDGTMFNSNNGDWFIAGLSDETGSRQITYHMSESRYWSLLDIPEREFAPEYDGHSPDDVLERLVSFLD